MKEGTPSPEQLLAEHIELILFFGAIALIANWVAWTRNFYSLASSKTAPPLPVPFQLVVGSFAIYLGASWFLAPIFSKVFTLFTQPSSPSVSSLITANIWLQLLILSLTVSLLFFICSTQPARLIKRIWKDTERVDVGSIFHDFRLGIAAWVISFPLVIAVGQICDLFIDLIFGFQAYEQVAVRYLKSALSSPAMLGVALITILLAAPTIEEFLFRGLLQNWFKKYLGAKAAILITSLCFALFHLSPTQGIGNISLVFSLFLFALFLGFIYERQGSLFASIGLHMAFNFVSSFRILFLQE